MAYQYDEIQGEPHPAHEGSQTQLAGDVIDKSQTFEVFQKLNARIRTSKDAPIPDNDNAKIIKLPVPGQ